MVILCSGRSHLCRVGQYDDAVVACADANLVFSANHSVGIDAAELTFLYGKLLVAVVEHAAEVGHDNFLTGTNVRRSADNLLQFAAPEVYRGDV